MTRSSFGHLPSEVLDAIHEAALTITSELSLPVVLNRIVTLARDLVGARYAALGIPDPTGSYLVQFIISGLTKEEEARIDRLPEGRGLLGALLEPGAEPIRVKNLAEDPRSVGFPSGHPVMVSFLGVPIRSRGKLLGNLYLTDKVGADEFSEQDEKIIETLAGYAAVAIENARLYQQVQRLAVLEERERIGMDLHDGIIQSIYAVGLMLEYVHILLGEHDVEGAGARVQEAITGLNTIIKDIRNYILDLSLERFRGDLESALRRILHEFRANTLADVSLQFDPQANNRLSDHTASAAFHIAQEAIANTAKHAAATNLGVCISVEDGYVVVDIQDNGRGFSVEDVDQYLGHGLSNLDIRARSVGGHVQIQSVPGQGTKVKAYLPTQPSKTPQRAS